MEDHLIESGTRLALPKHLEQYDVLWELHTGELIELMVYGRWVPARVEWDNGGRYWYAVIPQDPDAPKSPQLSVRLYPGLTARLPAK